jgi:hypothetical protein
VRSPRPPTRTVPRRLLAHRGIGPFRYLPICLDKVSVTVASRYLGAEPLPLDRQQQAQPVVQPVDLLRPGHGHPDQHDPAHALGVAFGIGADQWGCPRPRACPAGGRQEPSPGSARRRSSGSLGAGAEVGQVRLGYLDSEHAPAGLGRRRFLSGDSPVYSCGSAVTLSRQRLELRTTI